MIYPSDITNLLSSWEKRLKENTRGDSSYWLALNECIVDLKGVLNASLDEQLQQIEKDRFFDSLSEEEIREYFEDDYIPEMDDARWQ